MSSELSSTDLLAPYEIIFSCAICQTTITELYRRPRTDHGFSSGGDQERVVTRLWLTECGHLTCNDHLEGGGMPFHPQGTQPSAPCPLCVAEKNDSAPKPMYSIHGLHLDEHDDSIPKEYFEIPPAELNGKKLSTNALRFQWLSLLRFAGKMEQRHKEAARSWKVAEVKALDLATSLQETRSEAAKLRTEVERLRVFELKYQSYKKKEPEIRHHLSNVAGLAKENNWMKHELERLGFDIPRTTWSYRPPDDENGVEVAHQNVMHREGPDQKRMIPHASTSSGKKRTHREYSEGSVPNRDKEEFVPLQSMRPPLLPRQSGAPRASLETYRQTRWRNPYTSDEGLPLQLSAQTSSSYMMSGAVPPRAQGIRPHCAEIARGNAPVRESQASPAWNQSAQMPFRPAISLESPHFFQCDNINFPQGDPRNGQATLIQSSSPAMRHSFMPTSAVGPLRDTGPTYLMPSNDQHAQRQLLGRQSAVAPPCQPTPQSMAKMMDNSFFQPQTPVRRTFQDTGNAYSFQAQPAQLVSCLDYMRMDDHGITPAKTSSLNSLSFIQEPYSQSNRPVFSRQTSRGILPRATTSKQMVPAPYTIDARVPPQSNAVLQPSTTTAFERFSKKPGVQPTGLGGVKGSSMSCQTYDHLRFSGHKAATLRFPYQQQRVLNTASGCRSIRR